MLVVPGCDTYSMISGLSRGVGCYRKRRDTQEGGERDGLLRVISVLGDGSKRIPRRLSSVPLFQSQIHTPPSQTPSLSRC